VSNEICNYWPDREREREREGGGEGEGEGEGERKWLSGWLRARGVERERHNFYSRRRPTSHAGPNQSEPRSLLN